MYGTGISREGDLVDLASESGIIEKSGSWFSFKGERIGPNICYEDLFGEDFARSLVGPEAATVLANASNLAWFGPRMVQDQHLQFSRMRALEFERITGRQVIGADGQVQDPTEILRALKANVDKRFGKSDSAAKRRALLAEGDLGLALMRTDFGEVDRVAADVAIEGDGGGGVDVEGEPGEAGLLDERAEEAVVQAGQLVHAGAGLAEPDDPRRPDDRPQAREVGERRVGVVALRLAGGLVRRQQARGQARGAGGEHEQQREATHRRSISRAAAPGTRAATISPRCDTVRPLPCAPPARSATRPTPVASLTFS